MLEFVVTLTNSYLPNKQYIEVARVDNGCLHLPPILFRLIASASDCLLSLFQIMMKYHSRSLFSVLNSTTTSPTQFAIKTTLSPRNNSPVLLPQLRFRIPIPTSHQRNLAMHTKFGTDEDGTISPILTRKKRTRRRQTRHRGQPAKSRDRVEQKDMLSDDDGGVPLLAAENNCELVDADGKIEFGVL